MIITLEKTIISISTSFHQNFLVRKKNRPPQYHQKTKTNHGGREMARWPWWVTSLLSARWWRNNITSNPAVGVIFGGKIWKTCLKFSDKWGWDLPPPPPKILCDSNLNSPQKNTSSLQKIVLLTCPKLHLFVDILSPARICAWKVHSTEKTRTLPLWSSVVSTSEKNTWQQVDWIWGKNT